MASEPSGSLSQVKSADGGPAKTIVFANSKREADAGLGIEELDFKA